MPFERRKRYAKTLANYAALVRSVPLKRVAPIVHGRTEREIVRTVEQVEKGAELEVEVADGRFGARAQ